METIILMPLHFRQANTQDLPALLELEQDIITAERPLNALIKAEPTHYYDIEQLINSDNTCLMVADNKGSIIGCGYAQIRPSKNAFVHDIHAYLGFMYVSPPYRGRGINQSIVDHLITWGITQGAADFYLDVYSNNTAAINAYSKCGFTPSLLEMKLSLTDTQ